MGVFTTQTLLNSVGVSKHRTTPGAVAINWILKVQMESLTLSAFSLLTFYLGLGLDIRMWKILCKKLE